MKGLILFQDPKHKWWFYARASFLTHEIERIWVPIAICRVWWNNHQKLSQLQAFWYHVFQTLLILNGRIDATNNHKHMKFHIIRIKHLINVMLKVCFKILMYDRSNMHLKTNSHYFWTGVYFIKTHFWLNHTKFQHLFPFFLLADIACMIAFHCICVNMCTKYIAA